MAIDVSKIIHAVMEGSKIRESKGIIPLFGVYLSLFSVYYYNRLSFEFEIKMGQQRETEAKSLLIAAAQECGYATFQGIRDSWEWRQVVAPMVEDKKDEIYGFVAVAVAFGWGDLAVEELVPGEKLVMRASDSYESSGYLEQYGAAKSGKCYMMRGVTAAFMDLVYSGDYPDGCFTFVAQEPRCRVKGDPCCEFIAQRPSD
ncbi:MAG: hypothetical protein KJP06_01535 [Deltaproteobacteria bacterium]|nr:hypothetical protein [Deltaproteobacteria bacterium]